jgi:UTP--glucose-1-phosphate uridylyltransferase
MKRIRKAIFPVAGLGTRFLPATKATPKEMLPIVDKPLIQFAVEEAIEAGLTDMIFVTGRTKRAIEDHFDMAYELETELIAKHKSDLLEVVRSVLPKGISCVYIRQAEPLGLGHAVGCARNVVDDEPFAVILADDLIDGEPAVLKQMAELYERELCSVLGVEEVPREHTRQYGIVKTDGREPGVVSAIVEKPQPEHAPSTLAVVGRYILKPRIFHHLARVQAGAGGEIQLTDGIAALLKEEKVLAYRFKGKRYDCGSKLGYLQAMVEYGIKHPETGAAFAAYLKAL